MTDFTTERIGRSSEETGTGPPPVDPRRLPKKEEGYYEIIDGQILRSPPMWVRPAFLLSKLLRLLGPFTHARGRVLAQVLYSLAADHRRQRRPDLSFVSHERWPERRGIPRGDAWQVVPDLAIEILSPDDPAVDLIGRIRDFFEAGVRQVWAVFPDEAWIYVYDSPKSIRVLDRADTLDGGAILPGFRLHLADFFEPEGEEAAGDQAPEASAGAAE